MKDLSFIHHYISFVVFIFALCLGCSKHDYVDSLISTPMQQSLEQITKNSSHGIFVILAEFEIPEIKYVMAIGDNPPQKRTTSVRASNIGTGFAITKHDILTNHYAISMDFAKIIEQEIVNEIVSEIKTDSNMPEIKILSISTENYIRKVFILHNNWEHPVKVNTVKEGAKTNLVWLHSDEEMDILHPLTISPVEPLLGNIVYALGYSNFNEFLLKNENDMTWINGVISKTSIDCIPGYINRNKAVNLDSMGEVYIHNININSGYNGGPLLDVDGKVIGVNCQSADSTSIHLGIAISEVKEEFPILWEKVKKINTK